MSSVIRIRDLGSADRKRYRELSTADAQLKANLARAREYDELKLTLAFIGKTWRSQKKKKK
jgi:hypothetical protein